MHCFRHSETPAVGVCRACNKGLCRECAAELNFGLACRNSCEERVDMLNRIVDTSARSIAVSNSAFRSSGTFLMLMGCLLMGLAFYTRGDDSSPLFTGLFGGCGLLIAVFGTMRRFATRYPNVPESRRKP